ncbi:MAG: hypothetical protein FJY85_13710 [Deltaproteobacteria bacterium]|nr:hypothetical protein [Deltaproteobacteria bacterium]
MAKWHSTNRADDVAAAEGIHVSTLRRWKRNLNLSHEELSSTGKDADLSSEQDRSREPKRGDPAELEAHLRRRIAELEQENTRLTDLLAPNTPEEVPPWGPRVQSAIDHMLSTIESALFRVIEQAFTRRASQRAAPSFEGDLATDAHPTWSELINLELASQAAKYEKMLADQREEMNRISGEQAELWSEIMARLRSGKS